MYYFVTEIYEKCLGKKKQLDDVDEIFYKVFLPSAIHKGAC